MLYHRHLAPILRFKTRAFAVLLPLALAACGGGTSGLPGFDSGTPAAGGAAPTGQTIGTGKVKVGLILPLTAEGQGAVVGNSLKNAAEMALAEFPNADLTLLVKDDRGTPDGARAAAQEALSEGAELIVGPLFAPSVQAAGQVARGANKPVIAFSSDSNVASRGVYLLSFPPENDVNRVIGYAAQQGRKSFAALVPDTAYGKVVEAAFQQAVANRGARVAAIERFSADPAAMKAAIQRLMPSLAQADALFVPAAADAMPTLGQLLQEAGYNPAKVKPLGTGVWNDAGIARVPAIQGGWFASPDTAGFNAFAGRYQQRFNGAPTRTATLAYDAVSLAAALARTQGSQRFSEAVLTNGSGFAGADGVFRFRPDGQVERGLAVLELRNGQIVTINAAPRDLGPRSQ
ncbi:MULTISPECIES: penicillin-binding protein activator [Bosea]|uniref:ABC-type branched-chain amino acid transport system, substrate-binding protein n=1 Tax=Bosea robiniae TaxID=1036780 RepID=A0ABY0P1L7_9HYPH|nr:MULTISPECIES: penicillin-binding protein activator [Bosea]SDG56336.1 ABC-type branched-chain amino acid transport system, substrate-binding protein [Bosea robiniae]